MANIALLHGTDHVIKKPEYALGKETNDYGKGFYCALLPEMAKEWACKQNTNGFINEYTFDSKIYLRVFPYRIFSLCIKFITKWTSPIL
ncbi:MAG: DUF3990 domain-containing protein [Clostridia bacterium]|nr:DUF3990 domain-containing protein [Clostridia bacterium]